MKAPDHSRLLLMIMYQGPWERVSNFCYGLRRDPECTLRWDIPQDPTGWRWVMAKIGDWAEARDRKWQDRYKLGPGKPHDRWKRRV